MASTAAHDDEESYGTVLCSEAEQLSAAGGCPVPTPGLLASVLPLAHARLWTHLHVHKTQEDGGPGHPDAAVQSGAAKPWIAGAAPAAALSVNGTWT